MKKLSKLSDVPEWFDIKKYDKARSLELEGWYEQINKRFHVQVAVDIKLMDPEYTRLDYEVDRWLRGIKRDPIFKDPEIALLDFIRNADESVRAFFEESFFRDTAQKSVRDFIAGDLNDINTAIKLNCSNRELIDFCINGTYNEELMDLKALIDLHDAPIRSLNRVNLWIDPIAVPVMVNVYASDEQLDQDFKSWVRQAREDFNCSTIEEMFTDKDFKAWCKYAILPYFDLTTWARLNNAEFTQPILEILSNLVFKDLNQAATRSDSIASIPSLNFTPSITFAR